MLWLSFCTQRVTRLRSPIGPIIKTNHFFPFFFFIFNFYDKLSTPNDKTVLIISRAVPVLVAITSRHAKYYFFYTENCAFETGGSTEKKNKSLTPLPISLFRWVFPRVCPNHNNPLILNASTLSVSPRRRLKRRWCTELFWINSHNSIFFACLYLFFSPAFPSFARRAKIRNYWTTSHPRENRVFRLSLRTYSLR